MLTQPVASSQGVCLSTVLSVLAVFQLSLYKLPHVLQPQFHSMNFFINFTPFSVLVIQLTALLTRVYTNIYLLKNGFGSTYIGEIVPADTLI